MRREKKTKRFNAAHEVYERIVSALQSGVAIWKKPWVDGATPMNVVTKRAYNGFNTFALNMVCIERGYATGRFLPLNNAIGWEARSGKVKRQKEYSGVIMSIQQSEMKPESW